MRVKALTCGDALDVTRQYVVGAMTAPIAERVAPSASGNRHDSSKQVPGKIGNPLRHNAIRHAKALWSSRALRLSWSRNYPCICQKFPHATRGICGRHRLECGSAPLRVEKPAHRRIKIMTITRGFAAAAMLAGLAPGTASAASAEATMSRHYLRTETDPQTGQSETDDW
jgi:hypothetical protein